MGFYRNFGDICGIPAAKCRMNSSPGYAYGWPCQRIVVGLDSSRKDSLGDNGLSSGPFVILGKPGGIRGSGAATWISNTSEIVVTWERVSSARVYLRAAT